MANCLIKYKGKKMKLLIKIVLLLIIPLYLIGAESVTNKRLIQICTKIGFKVSLENIQKRDVLMLTHNNGLSFLALHESKLTLVTINENHKVTNKTLEKINTFNQNLLFARAFINTDDTALSSNLAVNNGASDIKIINFIGAFLATRESFLENFTK